MDIRTYNKCFHFASGALSVAIVTDDSVVMTESIYHRIEQGDNPLITAVTGSKNVIFAIISTSIILLATLLCYYLSEV